MVALGPCAGLRGEIGAQLWILDSGDQFLKMEIDLFVYFDEFAATLRVVSSQHIWTRGGLVLCGVACFMCTYAHIAHS